MGIESIGSNPAIALGGLEEGITLLDVSKFFSTLAANGYYREPVCILKITDSNGDILYEYDPDKNENNKQIMGAPAAYYTTKILERVVLEGTGKGANIGRPAAGKTGTTSDYRDAWFGRYTPELATVVWMGYMESNRPMEPIDGRNLTGGSYPADIWREYMIAALADKPVLQFEAPEDIIIENETAEDTVKEDNVNEDKKGKGPKDEKARKRIEINFNFYYIFILIVNKNKKIFLAI